VLDLTETNPPRVGLSAVAKAAQVLAGVGPAGYEPDPRGGHGARAALGAYYGARGQRVPPERFVLTTSTSESYAHLFRLLADPGQAFLVPSPSYPLFEPLARAEGVELRPYRLAFDGHWHLDRASFEQAAPGAKAVIVVEPNHPTGSCLEADERAFVEEVCAAHGLAIVSDEVFGDFPRPGGGPHLPTWLGERRVPTFVLGGLSKLCGLPHLKLGWIAVEGPERERHEALAGLEWLADLFLSVGSPVQSALPRLLELRAPFVARVHERIATNLAALAARVKASPELSLLPADGGWSAVLRLPATRTDEVWALALLERGVAAHPGHFFDVEGGAHLVLSLIVEPQAFSAGLEALGTLIREG